ncbi:MAG: starch-binding protein [Ferruginibacter sp.]
MKKLLLLPLLLSFWCTVQAQVDFRKETIYFLLPTRFFDGDSTNNRPNEWCSYIPGVTNPNITDPKDVTWRGDFKGLIEKLDYIKNMGFTAIWITPIVQNRGPLDYHGYHAWDFMKTDPRLESAGATFEDVVAAAHAKGMKVVLDIVTNHSGRYGIKSMAEMKYNTDTTKVWGKKLDGTALTSNPNWEYDGLNANSDDNKIWSRANLAPMPAPYNQNLAAYNWPGTESFVSTSDINWFHHSGNGFAQGWDDTTNLYQRAIADDCPDLNTGSIAVQDYLFNAYKRYLDAGVDAFRWDTWKHMNKQDIFALYDRLKAYKPNLFVFGEVAQKRHELHPVEEINPHWYTWRGAVGSSASAGVGVLDFFAESTFHGVFEEGGSLSGVTAAARYDHLYSDPSILVTWLDNHDFGPNNDWNKRYSGSDVNLAACMNFMFTWRGIPSFYYGTENRFKSGAYCDLHDGQGTQKSLDETGRAYFGDAMATASSHIIYRHMQKLNAIRKAIPALQTGNWNWAGNAPGNGVGYTRQDGSSFVCVGLAKDGSASFNFTGISNGIYRDAVTGRTITVSSGNLAFTVTSGSAGIYVKDGPGMIGESGAGFFEPCVTGCVAPVKMQISPIGTNYTNPVSVTMQASGGTPGYTIYYTTDGSMPTTGSTVYSAAFSVSTTTVVRAIAVDAAGKVSELQAERYTFILPPPTLTVTPASGNYYNPLSVTMTASGTTAPYTIYYTTDGSTPTTSSTVYSSALAWSTPGTIKAIAKDANQTLSTVVVRSYTFNIPAPIVTANPGSGNFNGGSVAVTLQTVSPRPPVTVYYTTDGTVPTTASLVYSAPINLSGGNPDTLTYFGVDAESRQSVVQQSIYTYYPIPDITVYFKRPANWQTGIKIHYWNGVPANVYTPTTWPGVSMTPVCADWYKFTFSGLTSTNLIFNDGAGNQTGNLSATQTGYYDNAWLATVPNITDPVANFSASPSWSGVAPYVVTFNGSISTSCNGIQQYAWDLGNGNTASGASPTTTYLNPGIYSVSLTITDGSGVTNTLTKLITVTNTAPGFWIYFKKPTTWASTVKLRYWNRNPGGLSITAPGVDMSLVCGDWYKYFLSNTEATDLQFNDGGANLSAELNANSATTFMGNRKILGAPLLNETLFANFEMSPATGVAPQSVSFTSDASIACNTITQYQWNFNDGSAVVTGATPTHIFANSGVYNVSLTITDNLLQTHTLSKRLVIGQSGGNVKVHFRRPGTWAATPRLYFWNPLPVVSTTAWPGITMTDEGNNWYVHTITGADCTNLIFNNNGSPQTADQNNICGEQWFDNGWLSQVSIGAPIPVTLVQFTAQPVGSQIKLQWQTDHELGVQQYEVERSFSGYGFTPMGIVLAKNVLGSRQNYQLFDVAVPAGVPTLFSRLKVKENNRRIYYSATVKVNVAGVYQWHVYPNPTHSSFMLQPASNYTGAYRVVVKDVQGRVIQTESNAVATALQVTGRQRWTPGIYVVEVFNSSAQKMYTTKLVVQ